jgi:hypothetical protein
MPQYEPSAEAYALATKQLVEPARRSGHELTYYGEFIEPPQPIAFRSNGAPWLLVPYEQDPVGAQFGGYVPLPRETRDELGVLANAGVDPDVVWVLHEMPADWTPEQPAIVDVPVPPDIARREERALRILDRFGQAIGLGLAATVVGELRRTWPLLDRMASRINRVASRVQAAQADPPRLERGADNLILGGVRDPQNPEGILCYVLVRWTWP